MSLRSDLPAAITGTWMVLAVAAGAAVIAPLILPGEVLYGLAPECEAKARGSECAFCGMTTGFILIARGDLSGAAQSNAGAPALYATFAVNFIAAVAYSIAMPLVRRRAGDQKTCKSSL